MKKINILFIFMAFIASSCRSETEVAFDEFLNNKEAKIAIEEFLTIEEAESFMVLPLCKAGEKVIPLLLEKIKDKNMERRRYAIGFLGVYDNRKSIPLLQTILKDEAEKEYFRGDALESLHLLDENLGKDFAIVNERREDFLGKISREILEITNYATYRRERRYSICNPQN